MKTFRVYRTVEAENAEDAIAKLNNLVIKAYKNEITLSCPSLFTAKENPFTECEELTVMEAARVALTDAEVYDWLVDKLDLSDKELKILQEKMQIFLDNP